MAISLLSKKQYKRLTNHSKLELIKNFKMKPYQYINDEILSPIAYEFIEPDEQEDLPLVLVDNEMEQNVFGRPLIKSNAYQQMKTAMKLPIVRRGALMPDSHLSYDLPIGAALATENAIIPFAIGMDIGCRMSLTIYEVTERFL